MAKDIYFNNVPPKREDPPPKTTAKRSGRRNAPPPPEDLDEPPCFEYNDPDYAPPRQRSGGRRAPAPASPAPNGQPRKKTAAKKQQIAPPHAPPAAPEPKKKKKHPVRRFFAFLLVLLLLCGGVLAVGGVAAYQTILADYTPVAMNKSGVVDQASLMHSNHIYNILLMGVDQADVDSATRSDSMILMSIDKWKHQIKLTSFMRDMYVTIPGYGETKLNHACMYQGPQLTIDTIELNFGVRIDAYAKIGYDIFIELVNGVGGITVAEIDETECRALAEEGVHKEPGTNIYLTGEEAVKYVRIRHWQSDFARTERQREVITLIIEKAKKTPPHKLIAMAKSIASKIECTVEKEKLLKLAVDILPCLTKDIPQQQIPADGTWSDATRDSLMVLLVDFDRNKEIIKNFIYGG